MTPRRVATGVLVLPGVLWLAAFFLLPLLIILEVSVGAVDPAGHVTLASLSLLREPNEVTGSDQASH